MMHNCMRSRERTKNSLKEPLIPTTLDRRKRQNLGYLLALTETDQCHIFDVVTVSTECRYLLITLEIWMLLEKYIKSRGIQDFFLQMTIFQAAFPKSYGDISTSSNC